ncbi:MAG: hypothetical protein IPK68_11300 [Bdellovibrionales bacterium]|nr:hypothetical protein [Bdellovibrionales bacterium]
MRIVMTMVLLVGSFSLASGCLCNKKNEEPAATDTLEAAPDSQQSLEGDPSQGMPEQPIDEGAPVEGMEEGHPGGGSESPE